MMYFRLVVALSLMVSAGCYRSYQNRIPNGHNVLNPCDGTIWPGVGHRNPGGRGTLNAFGEAFRDAGYQWTQELCMADSDGDGMTNGQELGDNDCSWTSSNGRALGSVKGHPGICEPLDSLSCSGNWFSCQRGPLVG